MHSRQPSVCTFVSGVIGQAVCLCAGQCVSQSVSASVSVCQSMCQSIGQSGCQSVYPSACRSVCQSVCLSLYVSLSVSVSTHVLCTVPNTSGMAEYTVTSAVLRLSRDCPTLPCLCRSYTGIIQCRSYTGIIQGLPNPPEQPTFRVSQNTTGSPGIILGLPNPPPPPPPPQAPLCQSIPEHWSYTGSRGLSRDYLIKALFRTPELHRLS